MDIVFLVALLMIPAILVGVLITRLNRSQWRYVQRMREKDGGFSGRMRHPVFTQALVVSKKELIQPDAGGFAKVDLSLEFTLPSLAPCQVNTTWLVKVESLDQVTPGKVIPVQVEQNKPGQVIPNVPWATPWIFGKN